MKVKTILYNSVWFGIVPKIGTFINVLLLPFITQHLTPADYGLWGIISSYVGIFTSFTSLGLHVHLTNSYFEYPTKYNLVWSRMLFILIISSACFSLITFIVFIEILRKISLDVRLWVSLFAVVPILLYPNHILSANLFPLKGTPKPYVLRNLVASIIGISVTFIFIYFLNAGYKGFVIGAATTSVVEFLIFIRPVWIKEKILPVIERNKVRLKNYFKVALPLIPHSLGFILLSSANTIIMDFYRVKLGSIGLYSNGIMIGNYISIVATGIITAVSPLMQKLYRDRNFSEYRRLFILVQGVVLLAISIFSIFMHEIYAILIRNQSLQPAQEIASYTCFINAVFPLYNFLSNITFIEKKTINTLWLVFVPALINILLTLIAIPLFGYKSVIITTIIAYWSQLFIPIAIPYFRQKTVPWFGKSKNLFFVLLSYLLMLGFTNLVSHYGLIIRLIISTLMVSLGCVFCYKRHLLRSFN